MTIECRVGPHRDSLRYPKSSGNLRLYAWEARYTDSKMLFDLGSVWAPCLHDAELFAITGLRDKLGQLNESPGSPEDVT